MGYEEKFPAQNFAPEEEKNTLSTRALIKPLAPKSDVL